MLLLVFGEGVCGGGGNSDWAERGGSEDGWL